ncbi:hypothetical protein [Ulvibacter antarcticus]|uniref:Uncharacterized protein n=1 Tax=Ulvibacter antarcticus TaxID=442714 RepID=A0A3L9YDR7_9FLAO|nr:hypothetical protein [Ulvibacter antarcticus]RMA56285.1 hypothetical protein BXY75_3406 [Ulvibacter antarcticus]
MSPLQAARCARRHKRYTNPLPASEKKLKFIEKLINNPRKVFLFDAIGAFISSVLLFGVLGQLEKYFGMPRSVVYNLAGVAVCLFAYSVCCHRFVKTKWKPLLGVIIVSNSIYFLISLGQVIKHSEKLTELGWIYFISELIIIATLVNIEIRTYLNQTNI